MELQCCPRDLEAGGYKRVQTRTKNCDESLSGDNREAAKLLCDSACLAANSTCGGALSQVVRCPMTQIPSGAPGTYLNDCGNAPPAPNPTLMPTTMPPPRRVVLLEHRQLKAVRTRLALSSVLSSVLFAPSLESVLPCGYVPRIWRYADTQSLFTSTLPSVSDYCLASLHCRFNT